MRLPQVDGGETEGLCAGNSLDADTVGRDAGEMKYHTTHETTPSPTSIFLSLTVLESSGSKKSSIMHITIVTETHHIHVECPAQLLILHTQKLWIYTLVAAHSRHVREIL